MYGKNMYLSFLNEEIYEDAEFNIEPLDKVGITGVNGAGKTTLFKVILGNIKLDKGTLYTGNKVIGYLPQEVEFTHNENVYEYLLSARPIKKLEDEIAFLYTKISDSTDQKYIDKTLKVIAKKQEVLETLDYYNYENILLNIIDKMHIDLELLEKNMEELSGGQKSKIAFAHLLYSKSDILLLDEPTNHLDLETRDYIINYLKNYKGMVLIISHDIPFLNSITNKTMYLDKTTHKITMYKGNYDEFMKKYNLQKELRNRMIENQEKEAARLRDIVLLYSNSSGKRKRMAQDREKKLAKLEENILKKDVEYKKVRMNLKPLVEPDKVPLSLNNIDFNYDGQSDLYNNLSFVISPRERFLIVGENGVGKSTLLKLIVGLLKPSRGSIYYGKKTEIAYYAQEQENLDLDKTILEKDVNLEITKKLRDLLESSGATVIMTRDRDVSLYQEDGNKTTRQKYNENLKNRKKIINESNADIFVSIHLNAFEQSKYYGAQTFYPKGKEDGKELAQFIQDELKRVVDQDNDRKIKPRDDIYLLKNATMPSVLIECGFLSNEKESQLLADSKYQDKIAWAIYVGIQKYLSGIAENN